MWQNIKHPFTCQNLHFKLWNHFLLLNFFCLYVNITTAQEYTKIVTEKGNGTLKTSHTIALDAYISVHPNRFSFFFFFFSFPSFFFAVVKDLGLPCGFEVYNKERKLYHIILDWFFNLGPTICLQLDVAFLANQAWSFDSLTNIRPQRGGSLVMVSLILHFLLTWF